MPCGILLDLERIIQTPSGFKIPPRIVGEVKEWCRENCLHFLLRRGVSTDGTQYYYLSFPALDDDTVNGKNAIFFKLRWY